MNKLLQRLKEIWSKNKLTLGLVGGIVLALIIGISFFNQAKGSKAEVLLEDIELNFDAEGPYAILEPRRDGNALTLHVKRVGSYDALSYTIAYTDETGIDRGAGDLNTWIDLKSRGDYEQEILFGTCSKGATMDPKHCVFDKGVENGTLTLRFRKGNQPYKMLTQWHLQKPDVALGNLMSGDGHFDYITDASREELGVVAYTIINDLTGVPKLPEGKTISGKAYTLNTPSGRQLPKGKVLLELGEAAPAGSKFARYIESQNKWEELETKESSKSGTLEAEASGSGIFILLSPLSK